MQLRLVRHDDPVSRRAHLLHRAFDAGILLLLGRKLGENVHKIELARDLEPRLFRQQRVKQRLRQLQLDRNRSCARVDVRDGKCLHLLEIFQGLHRVLCLRDFSELPGCLPHRSIQGLLDLSIVRQRPHPAGQAEPELRRRKLVHEVHQNPLDLLFVHCKRIDRPRADAVFLREIPRQRLCFPAFRVLGVHENDKRLSGREHIGNRAVLRGCVVACGNVRDASVRRHNNSDAAVLLHDLLCPDLRRLLQGKLCLRPRGHDHPGRSLFLGSHRAGDQIADRVDEPDFESRCTVRRNFHCLLGHKLWLRRHDRPAGAGLGQLVARAVALIGILQIWKHQLLHKALDKG